MQYTIIKELSADKKQLNDYIKAMLPDFIPQAMIE